MTSLVIAMFGILVAATLQSATGFGFALVAAPVLYAVSLPPAAVAVVLVLSQVVNVLVLFAERRSLKLSGLWYVWFSMQVSQVLWEARWLSVAFRPRRFKSESARSSV